ncbi:unnamed protein product [Penicillium nalgiovense]|nr:unnamed protein product [Penicillium nalgiovense]
MRPIDVGRVPRVEPLGRPVSGHRDRDLPVFPIWVDNARSSEVSLGFLPAAARECSG